MGPRRGAYHPWVVACPKGLIHGQVASVLYINPVRCTKKPKVNKIVLHLSNRKSVGDNHSTSVISVCTLLPLRVIAYPGAGRPAQRKPQLQYALSDAHRRARGQILSSFL